VLATNAQRYPRPALSLAPLLAQLDPDERRRGQQFERLCRWYLKHAPRYRGVFKDVWLWPDWPDMWGTDAGIDLVAEQKDGGLWAIQAKAYDPEYWIKKSDVDSWLSESSRPGFVYRLLIGTTDRVGRTAERTIRAQSVPVGRRLLSELEADPVVWPRSLKSLRAPRPKRLKPRPDQRKCVRDIKRGFGHTSRGQAVRACGTGKTVIGLWAAESLRAKRTLVLLPSLSLVEQTIREWTANASSPFEYLAVCSDPSVADPDEYDEYVGNVGELGFPVTTDPTAIVRFQRRRSRRVVFSTYQSSPKIAEAFRQQIPGFDLAIADEAHRCAGNPGGGFQTILDPGEIRARRRLFMTATPRYYSAPTKSIAGKSDEAPLRRSFSRGSCNCPPASSYSTSY
jgi:predicted helicase